MRPNKPQLYFHTLRHIKFIQLYYQVFYRIKNRFFNSSYDSDPDNVQELLFQEGIYYQASYIGKKDFQFLNLNKIFSEIDWNYSANGKLWTYNLNYFEFLNQEKITKEQGLILIQDYHSKRPVLKDGLEPYPISLRGINWIKFLSRFKIKEAVIDKKLNQDYKRLLDNLEYHLLANHLLENGFSLLFGAYYFQDDKIYKEAYKILSEQLGEQILVDGAHYELSPMYHQIILHRVLDCLNLVKNNKWKVDDLQYILNSTAISMLSWLKIITFKNGEIPKLNDSTNGIAPTTAELLKYAEELGIKSTLGTLRDSGYRKWENNEMELVMDVGQIAPSYQPGHSHADNLQFVLNYKSKAIIVDTGISTYEKNARRQLERSTASHNTITVNDLNSSNVWGGFRVAERAVTILLKDELNSITAEHNGYRKLGITHERTFQRREDDFQISDGINGSVEVAAKGHLHLHPNAQFYLNGNSIIINDNLQILFSNSSEIEVEEYMYAEAFNTLKPAKKLVYKFNKSSKITITPFS